MQNALWRFILFCSTPEFLWARYRERMGAEINTIIHISIASTLRRGPRLVALCALAACLFLPSVAQAQNVIIHVSPGEVTGFADGGDGDLRDRHVTGEIQTASYAELRNQNESQAKKCFEMGCIFFINETHGYDVIGMYLDTARQGAGAEPRWGPNQFRHRLKPRQVAWTYKAGDESMCNVPVRVELKKREGKGRVTVSGSVSLCKSAKQDTVFRINVVQPKVTLGDDPVVH